MDLAALVRHKRRVAHDDEKLQRITGELVAGRIPGISRRTGCRIVADLCAGGILVQVAPRIYVGRPRDIDRWVAAGGRGAMNMVDRSAFGPDLGDEE